MSDLDLDAIEERHADGYGLPRFVSFALIDEVRQLRERVATLEDDQSKILRQFHGHCPSCAESWERLSALLDPEDTP